MGEERYCESNVNASVLAREINGLGDSSESAIAPIGDIQRLELNSISPWLEGCVRPVCQFLIHIEPQISNGQIHQWNGQSAEPASNIKD